MELRKISLVIIISILLAQNLSAQNLSQGVHAPADYYQQRLEAIELAYSSQWEESALILDKLLEQYHYDSDLYYLIGLSSFERKNYQEAISNLKKCLDLGGASLRAVPTGSSPSNDIMVKIAMAYGHLSDKNNAILWLQKAFDARYDEKPFIMGDRAFEAFKTDPEFLELYGMSTRELSRDEAWQADLSFLEDQINQLSYTLHHGADSKPMENFIAGIKTNISNLSDEEIIVEIMKLMGSMGHGHNLIIPTTSEYGALKKLPIQLYQFSDGVFIVDASDAHQEWIGYEVESIAGIPIDEVLKKSNAVNSRDNDMQILWHGPYYIMLPDVLKSLGIIESTDKVTLAVKNSQSSSEKIELSPEAWTFTDLPKIPALKGDNQPLYLSQMHNIYWYTLIPEDNAMYVQFNQVANKEDISVKTFCEEWIAQIEDKKVSNLILDIRHNHGGDGSILSSMHQAIRKFKALNPEGMLFVLSGRETFSSAQNLLTEITQYTDPIIVGEPSGSSPNFVGESGWVRLPNSGLILLVSSQYHQSSFAEDHRKWIAPHMPVSLSSADYFEGKDPALEEIKKVIGAYDKK